MHKITKAFSDAVEGNALDKLLNHIHKLEDEKLKLERDLELSRIENKGLRDHIEILEDNL
jgi:hypothetical protein